MMYLTRSQLNESNQFSNIYTCVFYIAWNVKHLYEDADCPDKLADWKASHNAHAIWVFFFTGDKL